ncbi:PhoH family protein [Fictibacillus nanhaiensis]|uniref:PhoH family protein n=1 Tax=Fictibacillus nanhaiensis TaxID=742169 RepID=UPI002E1E0E60|nr:PhoH family protein [Fictibacillus nanhaiensis]MED1863247.1 PhoH family protein [Fictibacillus nanhaiensis]
MDKLVCLDTNVLLENPEIIHDYRVVVLSHVIRELEKHKLHMNKDLAYRARRATRYLKQHQDNVVFDFMDYQVQDLRLDENYTDNKIIEACLQKNYSLLTFDLLLDIKARGYGIEVLDVESKGYSFDEYTGVHEIYISSSSEDQELLASLYELPERNVFNLSLNQYLFIWDKEKPTYNDNGIPNGYEFIDSFKFDGEKLIKLKYKPLHSKFTGDKVKPINKKQEMLFDLLQNKDITIKACMGKYGVGKDYLMIQHALDLIESGKMDKIIWARNNVELADVPTLGILPGDKNEKLIEFAMPLADHVGGIDGLEMLLRQQKIEIQHLGSLRGRDIKNSIIYVTEFQNNTKEHATLLVGRVGLGSQLWLNGDLKQTDKDVYKNNSGLKALQKLKGQHLFGLVTLDKTERSDTAKLAELLDEE